MPGINTGIGARVNMGSGFSWDRYWKSQDEVLFFAETSNIADGKLYNQKTGASDYLTVTGAAGSYTFQCPNTAPYIAADTDYIWFKTDETQRTPTEAELIGYDLQRTPIKYDDDAPNSIRAIMILSSAVTGTKRDKMFKGFRLQPYWDDSENDFGYIKSNRELYTQTLWTPEPTHEEDVLTYIDGLDTELSDSQLTKLDTLVASLKSGLSIDNMSDAFDCWWIFGGETQESSFRNLVSRNYDAYLEDTANWTQFEGFTGGGSKRVFADYVPSTDGVKFTLNSASVGAYIREGALSTGYVVMTSNAGDDITAINDPTGARSNRVYVNDNGYGDVPITTGVGMTIKCRASEWIVRNFCNKNYGSNGSVLVNGLSAQSLVVLVPDFGVQVSIVFFGKDFTEIEMGVIQDACEAYMDSNSKGVIS